MYFFLIPLLLGFAFNLASSFTTAFSRRWGERCGSMISLILRDVLGIPVWAIGVILAVRAHSSELLPTTTVTNTIGWLLMIIGSIIILIALAAIGAKAAKPLLRDTLVNYGIYARIRHPIHSGVLLEFMGIFLVVPTITVALACIIGISWVLVQTRFEEIDLLQRLPGYQEYMNSVRRFFPHFRFWGACTSTKSTANRPIFRSWIAFFLKTGIICFLDQQVAGSAGQKNPRQTWCEPYH